MVGELPDEDRIYVMIEKPTVVFMNHACSCVKGSASVNIEHEKNMNMLAWGEELATSKQKVGVGRKNELDIQGI